MKFYKPNKKKQTNQIARLKERTRKISLLSSSVTGNGAESQREKERERERNVMKTLLCVKRYM